MVTDTVQSISVAVDSVQPSCWPQFGFGRAEDAVVIVQFGAAVTRVVNLQAVIQEVQIFLSLLALTHRVWIQNLKHTAWLANLHTSRWEIGLLLEIWQKTVYMVTRWNMKTGWRDHDLWVHTDRLLLIVTQSLEQTSSVTLNLFNRATNFCLKFGCWTMEKKENVGKKVCLFSFFSCSIGFWKWDVRDTVTSSSHRSSPESCESSSSFAEHRLHHRTCPEQQKRRKGRLLSFFKFVNWYSNISNHTAPSYIPAWYISYSPSRVWGAHTDDTRCV